MRRARAAPATCGRRAGSTCFRVAVVPWIASVVPSVALVRSPQVGPGCPRCVKRDAPALPHAVHAPEPRAKGALAVVVDVGHAEVHETGERAGRYERRDAAGADGVAAEIEVAQG